MADLFEQDRLKREGDKLQALVDETNAQTAMRKGQAPPGTTMLDDGTAAPGAPPPPAQPLPEPQPQYDVSSQTTTRGPALDPRTGLRIMAEQEANAEERRGAVESIGAEQQSAYAEHEAVQKQLAADQQAISERFGKEGKALSGRLAQLDASLEAQKADLKTLTPQAAATMSTFERVMVSMAAIAEGVRAGVTFTPNKAGQIVDQAIERDLGNQRARYAAKLKEMNLTEGQRREIMGRVDQASETQRTAAMQAATMRLASFASRTDSLAAKMKLTDAALSIDEKLTQSRAEIAQATARQSTTVTSKTPRKAAGGMAYDKTAGREFKDKVGTFLYGKQTLDRIQDLVQKANYVATQGLGIPTDLQQQLTGALKDFALVHRKVMGDKGPIRGDDFENFERLKSPSKIGAWLSGKDGFLSRLNVARGQVDQALRREAELFQADPGQLSQQILATPPQSQARAQVGFTKD